MKYCMVGLGRCVRYIVSAGQDNKGGGILLYLSMVQECACVTRDEMYATSHSMYMYM